MPQIQREHAARTPEASRDLSAERPHRAPGSQSGGGVGGVWGIGGMLELQRRAGNQIVESLLSRGDGQQLDPTTRRAMEAHLGGDLADVRIHADAEAAASADALASRAYTVGRHIVFGPGLYAPETPSGQQLLLHELAHTIQQRDGGGMPMAAEPAHLEAQAEHVARTPGAKPARGAAPRGVQRAPDRSKPQTFEFTDMWITINFSHFPNEAELRRAVAAIREVDDAVLNQSEAVPGPGTIPTHWTYRHPQLGVVAEFEIVPSDVKAGQYSADGTLYSKLITSGGKGKKKAERGSKPAEQPKKPPALKPDEQRRWDALTKLMSGGKDKATADPAELLHLYEELKATVEDPKLGNKGEPWQEFAKFLIKNKGKIEGIIGSEKTGQLTAESLQKIIDEYGRFIAAEPVEPAGEKDEFDRQIEYNPNWQQMSKEDRKMMIDLAKMAPDELRKQPIDFVKITQEMKLQIALKLSSSWPREILEAAKEAFSDWKFVVMLVVTLAIYVGLWLTPDPTFITKLAASALTVVLLAQFAWDDIYGLATAWFDLTDRVKTAKTVEQLKAAGDVFSKKVGAVGFDLLLFIATWGLGKATAPKLAKLGARRGVVRAEANVRTTESRPGTGVQRPAVGESKTLLDRASRPTAGETLDALGDLLPTQAKQPLKDFRNSIRGGDESVLKALKSELARGNDLTRFLTEKSVAPEVRTQAKAELLKARARLARAKLIEAETVKDPALRRAVREEQMEALKASLRDLGILSDPKVQRAVQSRNLNELIGELGEAIQRSQLRAKYPASQGYEVLANIELVREVPGFKTRAAWQAAERTAGRPGDVGGLYEKNGKLWKSIGNADALIAERVSKTKLRPIEIEEVKTGEHDTVKAARAQVAKVAGGLAEVAGGASDVRIFDRTGKNELGREMTDMFDLSNLSQLKPSTRGPEGRGFAQSLGIDEAILRMLAESLVENLPPAKPTPAVPPNPPSRKREEEHAAP